MDEEQIEFDTSAEPELVLKSTRRVLSLSTKMEILQQLESGLTPSSLGRIYNVNESTIRSIKTKGQHVINSVRNCSETSAKYCNKVREPCLEKMENMLSAWIEEQKKQNCATPTTSIIRNKALEIYTYLKKGEQITFHASKGWFEGFRKRQMTINSTSDEASKSIDNESVAVFIKDFNYIVDTGSYLPQQVFNMIQMELYWKRLPSKTFISVEEKSAAGFKASKDRVTLILCSNATGEHKCTPLILYHSKMPRALKNVHSLPLHWRFNENGRMTASIVEEWMSQCFAPEVQTYCSENGIPFKILLLLDASSTHLLQLDCLHSNINVIFLPPSTSTILQPLDKITNIFKLSYIVHILRQLHTEFDDPDKNTVKQFWRSYNIRHSTEMISRAWSSISWRKINMAWKTLWQECNIDFKGVEDGENEYIDEIVELGRKAHFGDFGESDVQELIKNNREYDAEEELEHLYKSTVGTGISIDNTWTEEVEANRDIEYEDLSIFMKQVNCLIQSAVEIDTNGERSAGVKRKIRKAVYEYQEMYLKKGKKKIKQPL